MSEATTPYPLPYDPEGHAEKAVVYLAWLIEQYGYVELRIWPDRTAGCYHVTAAHLLNLQAEHSRAVMEVAARHQAELEVLREAAQAVVAMARRDLVKHLTPTPLMETIVGLEATLRVRGEA